MTNKSSISLLLGLIALSCTKKGSKNNNSSFLVRTQDMLQDPLSYVNDPNTITYIEFQMELPNGIPSWISMFQNVEELVANEVDITTIPEEVFDLKRLEVLDVSRNPIESLPDSIKKLTTLRVLDITRTQIRHLPEGMFNYLPQLYHFEALHTPLEQINSDILNSNLRRFFISNEDTINLNFSMHDISNAVLKPNPDRDFRLHPNLVYKFTNILNSRSSSQLRRF